MRTTADVGVETVGVGTSSTTIVPGSSKSAARMSLLPLQWM
jgi:hypothetical protein